MKKTKIDYFANLYGDRNFNLVVKPVPSWIELNLDDGFGEDILSKLEKGRVIGIQDGIKFMIESYSPNGIGYLIIDSGSKPVRVEFEVHSLGERGRGYRLEQTEVLMSDPEECARKLKEAGIKK